jgi:selenocysteine lyase/cysteine desulfurase
VGALAFIDAVHFAPHRRMNVKDVGCDFLVCSAYKFFGPHVGIMWGRRDLLERIEPYKLRPAPTSMPGKRMTGTQNFEGICGVTAAIDYLANLSNAAPSGASRRQRLDAAFCAIRQHEESLLIPLLRGISELPGVSIWGISDPNRLDERVPTVSITHPTKSPQELAGRLAELGLFVWPGNHYALPYTEAMGLEPGGTLRIGLLHYNTLNEVERLLTAFRQLW